MIAGMMGTALRFICGQIFSADIGLLVANLAGSFLLGYLRPRVDRMTISWIAPAITAGFLGSLTSYSALAQMVIAHSDICYLIASTLCDLCSVFIGYRLGMVVTAKEEGE